MSPTSAADRVLVLTPTGHDAVMVCRRIVADGIPCEICGNLPALLAGISSGADAVVLAHEALLPEGVAALLALLEAQEPWSDIPVLLLLEARAKRSLHVAPLILEHANITILQRPLSEQLLLSSVRSAVRARRRQYQMRDLLYDLERAVQLSDMFVSILGHDLRTPLGAVKLSAETIVRLSSDPRALRPAGRIMTSVERMTRMIEQLLDFARVRLGQGLTLGLDRVDLGEICQAAVQEVVDANPHAELQLQRCGDLCGVWDADRLAQMVSNLVGNAVQHGTRDLPVSVELDGTDEGAVRLRVCNHGAVPPEVLPTLFEAFGQAPRSSAKTGLGLGLFIAREIARAHGGEMTVQTSGDQTTFETTLPREARPIETSAFAPS